MAFLLASLLAWSNAGRPHIIESLAEFEKCSIAGFDTSALAGAVPIRKEEFLARRDRIAQAREFVVSLPQCRMVWRSDGA